MKKILFILILIISVTSLFATLNENPFVKRECGDVIEIDVNSNTPVSGSHRSPVIIPIRAICYVDLYYVDVLFLSNLGDVEITITNFSYGSSNSYRVHSSVGSVWIPLNFGEGNYVIEFITLGGASYSGYFFI
jgi:hypothetical protein